MAPPPSCVRAGSNPYWYLLGIWYLACKVIIVGEIYHATYSERCLHHRGLKISQQRNMR